MDTLCDVYLNNKQVASLNNSYIPLNVDVKNELVEGENLVEFKFKSPYNYIVKRQQENARGVSRGNSLRLNRRNKDDGLRHG